MDRDEEKSSRDFVLIQFFIFIPPLFHERFKVKKKKIKKQNSFVGIKNIKNKKRKICWIKECVFDAGRIRGKKAVAAERCQRWSEYLMLSGENAFSIEFSEIYQSSFHTHNTKNGMKPFFYEGV